MGYTLAPEQLSAWHLQLPVLRAALAESVPGTNSAAELGLIQANLDLRDLR